MDSCKHSRVNCEDWPDGGAIEICIDCGMSRYLWEQGESDWVMVDTETARAELETYFSNKLLNNNE